MVRAPVRILAWQLTLQNRYIHHLHQYISSTDAAAAANQAPRTRN